MEKKTEDILLKLKKLIALQKSAKEIGSVAEAEAAAMAIKRLLDEYNLSMADVGEDCEQPTVTITESDNIRIPAGELFYFSRQLIAVICKYNFCQSVITHKGSIVEAQIVGADINVKTAHFLFAYLHRAFKHNAQNEAQKHSLHPIEQRNYHSSFLKGCIVGIDEKFNAEQSAQITDLAISHQHLIDNYFKAKNIDFKKSKTINSGIRDAGGFHSGFQFGRNININKPIENQSSKYKQVK